MTAIDTELTTKRLELIMEDYRNELKNGRNTAVPRNGTGLVHAIVERLIANHVDFEKISLWDMKRLIRDAQRAGSGRPVNHPSRTAS